MLQAPPGIDHAAVAQYVGDGCTVSAVRHRLARIKKRIADEELSAGTADSATPAAAASPAAKVKRVAKSTPTKSKDPNPDDENKEQHTTDGQGKIVLKLKLKAEDETDGFDSDEYECLICTANNDGED
ncbi:uncharacterized protein N7511_008217 [Penicillium nucicola]|uniref:uncharacterized protein n=1 Tax=Penicillium nucicola TaxID=1850975 RepID=UPI0025458391|nr:uncharacterized protein N7511_008217 [Penicillium nucicola]KAJ5754064.1 hypothetical protein N7511_008217 [Penicillium nucicola]